MTSQTANYDEPWKEALSEYFEPFLRFFFEVSLKFPTVKLLDYEARWTELEASTKIRGLYERGLDREQIIKLFQIIDRMMTLPSELQQSLDSKIKQFEEEMTMPLLSNMELRGMEIGSLQTARDFVKKVLQTRLGEIPVDVEKCLNDTSAISVLEKMLKVALTVNSFEECKKSFDMIKNEVN